VAAKGHGDLVFRDMPAKTARMMRIAALIRAADTQP